MSDIVLLFGKSYSGGGIELKNSSYAFYEYFSPDEKYTGKKIKDLNFEKCELTLLQKLLNTYKFLTHSRFSNYYITHSVQAIAYPILFRNKNFIWISQGVEVFLDLRTYWLFRIPFRFIINLSNNLKVRAVNPLLRDFLVKIGITKVVSDPYINLKPSNFKKVCRTEIRLFALYRDSKCKNPKLLKRLINSKNLGKLKWTVIDLSSDNNDELSQKKNVKYVRGPVLKEDLIQMLMECSHLVYPSYFEGFGLLVNEAIEVGVQPIIGPLSLFKEIDATIVTRTYKYSEWEKALIDLN